MEKQSVSRQVTGYVIGFGLSIITTLASFYLVINKVFNGDTLLYVILAIAVAQLIVQVVFFLHIGRESAWRAFTFYFTIFVVLILVIGTLWIMHNMNYNMMDMSPDQMRQYMEDNTGGF